MSIPYADDALQPAISSTTMDIHRDLHRISMAMFRIGLNSLQEAVAEDSLDKMISIYLKLTLWAGSYLNRGLFLDNLAPYGHPSTNPGVAPRLLVAICSQFGSMVQFKAQLMWDGVSIHGSGWCWLTKTTFGGQLRITLVKDDEIVPAGQVPIIGIDLWEHAYFIQYGNNPHTYMENIWNVINWTVAETRYLGTRTAAMADIRLSSIRR